MAIRRFCAPDLSSPVVRVEGPQAMHALRVLRLGVGESVVLFDGLGAEATGRILRIDGPAFDVEIDSRRSRGLENRPRLALAVAMPKGPRADWLIEKCAELGVGDLRPIDCERSVARPGPGKIDRWRRKCVEAAKQSRQAAVMQIHAPTPLDAVFRAAPGDMDAYYGSVHGDAVRWTDAIDKMEAAGALVLIGPEGGWTQMEIKALEDSGATAIRLADSILRVETAAVAVAAIWACCRPPG
jgi:16S rRNA (uracil1498-N3)-methyltransferase